jgi:hypothetical protein
MAGFGFSGRRLWTDKEFEEKFALMEPELFASIHFRRAAETLNTLLVLFQGHLEMPEFIGQLAAIVEDRPPDDLPPAGVLEWLPDDGPPSSGRALPSAA